MMENSKICSVCHLEFPLSGFTIYNKSMNYTRSYCKYCEKEKKYNIHNKEKNNERSKKYAENNVEKVKLYKKQWHQDNKDRTKEQSKITKNLYRLNNKEKIKEQSKIYHLKNKDKENKYYHENREIFTLRRKESRINNWEKIREREKLNQIKKRSDPFYRFKDAIRGRIRNSIKGSGYTKRSKSMIILGCSYEDFRNYIEFKFESWMNWDNYGLYNGESNYGWDIDHIIPLSIAKNEDDIIKLNHYTNLQPLCSYNNRVIKRASMI